MTKDKLIELSKNLKLRPKPEVLDALSHLSDDLLKSIDLIKNFETDAKPMDRVDETPISFLREDVPKPGLSKEDLLSNAPQVEGDFVAVPKGGNND